MDKTLTKSSFVRLKMPHKLIYTAIAVLLLVIGLAGLVIPIIPGILFLLGAVMLFSKVSSRVHRWSEGQAWVRSARIRMIQLKGLRPLSKLQFVLLLGVQSVASGLASTIGFCQRMLKRP